MAWSPHPLAIQVENCSVTCVLSLYSSDSAAAACHPSIARSESKMARTAGSRPLLAKRTSQILESAFQRWWRSFGGLDDRMAPDRMLNPIDASRCILVD